MATGIPSANTTLQDSAGPGGSGIDNIALIAPVASNFDGVPRLFGSADAINTFHGYGRHVEYAALHFAQTRKPILMCGVPIATAGAVTRVSQVGNTGTSAVTITAGANGVLHEHEGQLKVVRGGTVGTDPIVLSYTLDPVELGDNRLFVTYRLGTGTSLTLQVGVTISFAAGTLVAGDVLLDWRASDPICDVNGLATARAALAAQLKLCRSWLVCGDLPNVTAAQGVVTHAEAYETANQRFVYARASVKDRFPQHEMGHPSWKMAGAPSVTFVDGGTASDTITRTTGSWVTDGAATGDYIGITGTVSNNYFAKLTGVAATTLTVATGTVTAETATAGAAMTGYMGLSMATGGALTRSRGSWLTEGFATGDSVTIAGSALNNETSAATAVSTTVLTLSAGTAESLAATAGVTVGTSVTKAAWMAASDAAFASVNSKRVDLSAGRAPEVSEYSGWSFRIPAGWFASLREYQHDLHVATWEKDLGPVGGDLPAAEWDDRVDGSAGSQARFTTLRTWGNGPEGAFVTLSLTRGPDGSLTSLTNNMAVIDLAMTVCQATTENVVGRSLLLNSDGTATGDSRKGVEAEVNAALTAALLTNTQNEGQRASSAVWTMSSSDVLNHGDPTQNIVTGVLALNLRGIVFTINTAVRLLSGGQ